MKETKESIARWIVNYHGGIWKESFSVQPGSTVTTKCWKYIKELTLANAKTPLNIPKHITEMKNHGSEIESYVIQSDGTPRFYLKNT